MKFSKLVLTFLNENDVINYTNHLCEYKSYCNINQNVVTYSQIPDEQILQFIRQKNRAYRATVGRNGGPTAFLKSSYSLS